MYNTYGRSATLLKLAVNYVLLLIKLSGLGNLTPWCFISSNFFLDLVTLQLPYVLYSICFYLSDIQ